MTRHTTPERAWTNEATFPADDPARITTYGSNPKGGQRARTGCAHPPNGNPSYGRPDQIISAFLDSCHPCRSEEGSMWSARRAGARPASADRPAEDERH